jgi:hypothetical protein
MVRLRETGEENKQSLLINQERLVKIISCQVNKGELITKLDDERKIIIPVSILIKRQILKENVKPEQLKNMNCEEKEKQFIFLILMRSCQVE